MRWVDLFRPHPGRVTAAHLRCRIFAICWYIVVGYTCERSSSSRKRAIGHMAPADARHPPRTRRISRRRHEVRARHSGHMPTTNAPGTPAAANGRPSGAQTWLTPGGVRGGRLSGGRAPTTAAAVVSAALHDCLPPDCQTAPGVRGVGQKRRNYRGRTSISIDTP